MFCPFKIACHANPKQWDCEQAACQLWNERFGMCSLAVDAYLKGQEDRQKEKGIKD